MGTRTRKIPCEFPSSSRMVYSYMDLWRPWVDYKTVTNSDPSWIGKSYLMGGQNTDSESHDSWNKHRKGKFHGDLGGPFFTQKWWVELSSSGPAHLYGETWDRPDDIYPGGSRRIAVSYDGPIMPMFPGYMQFPTWSYSSEDDLNELGTTAISRCSPSNPSVDLAVTIGELVHEGLPKAIGATLRSLKSLTGQQRRQALGHEYLNVEFGWKPLINDLTDFAQVVLRVNDAFKQYERDSGRMVRRGYDFPEIKDTKIQTVQTNVSPWTDIGSGGWIEDSLVNKGHVVRTETLERRQWFRGAFAYYVPPPDGSVINSIQRAVIQARKTLGLSLTPDVLWNLAPWSWGLDWFGSTGDLIENWTDWAVDNQVLLYGYMMEHTLCKYTYTFMGPTGLKPASAHVPHVSFVTETKQRRKATPYGFGLRMEELSTRQKAIVAALGISRSR